MKSLIKLFFGIALVVLSIQSNVAQTTYSWVGGNGNWNLATNWSPNGVPTSSDNVLIATGGTYTVTLDVDATIADITVGGATGGFQAFLMNGRALTVNGTATISDSGKVSLTNSTVTGPGTLTNLGTMTVSGGTFNINIENEGLITFNGASSLNNDFSNQANSSLILSSHYAAGATLRVVDGLTNIGMIEFVSSYPNSYGTLELTSGTLVNESGGTIQSSSGFSRIFAPLDNRGSMILNRNMEINKESATHSNSGSIEVNLGNFSLKQTGTDPSFTSTGTITVESARILTIDGGTFNFSSGNLDLKGSFSIEDAMINFTPAFINKEILSIKNSELTCGSSFTNQNKLTLTNSTINGGATFFNQDNVTVLNGIFNMNLDNAGSMTFNGLTSLNNDLMIQPNSTFIISSHYAAGAVLRVVDGLTNNGMIEFVSSYPNSYGTLELTSGTLVNEPGGTIQSSSGFSRIFAPLDNRGSMILNRNMEINKESAAHSNSGSITVSNGNLKLTQTGTDPSFTSTGTITVESARILTVDGGIFNFNSGNLDSNGSFIIEDATVNFTPNFISKGLFNLDNSSLTCGNGFTSQNKFTLKNSTISGGGTFLNQDEISVYNGIFNMNLDNAGIMTFRGHTSLNNDFTTQSNSSFTFSSGYAAGAVLTVMNGFTNNGLIEFITSYSTTIGTLRLTNGTLVNASGGTIKNSTGRSRIDAAFDNQGSILLDRSMEINKDDAAHTNSGTITINKASEKLTLKGLSFSNQPTGILNGRGTIDISSIDFINSGVINPGTSSGKLNIKGNLPQDSQSIINIEIGGIVADDSYDQLNVSGQFLLDGKLNISLIDNYIPAAGETFDIMTFGSQTGDFNSMNGLFTGTGVSFDVVSNPTSLQLVTVSAPNHSPVLLNQIPDINLDEDFGSHLFADLDSIFDDSDIPLGDSLIYEFSIANGLLNGSIVDSELRLQSVSDSNGVISVVVTATDIGLLSISDTFLITINAVNDSPSIFSIMSPQDEAVLGSADTVNFTWDASSDKDEDQLVYTLKIYNASADTIIEGINETTFEFISNGFLQSNTTYNWTITVTDGTELVTSPDTFSFTTPVASSIVENFDWNAQKHTLSQNFPNPFTSITTILFNIPVSERITLKVYDHLGREVLILIDEEKPAGGYRIEFDASELKGGIYFYKIQAGDYIDSKKMILLK